MKIPQLVTIISLGLILVLGPFTKQSLAAPNPVTTSASDLAAELNDFITYIGNVFDGEITSEIWTEMYVRSVALEDWLNDVAKNSRSALARQLAASIKF